MNDGSNKRPIRVNPHRTPGRSLVVFSLLVLVVMMLIFAAFIAVYGS